MESVLVNILWSLRLSEMDTLSVGNSPVTESSNELTVRLGSSTTEMEILRALRGSDLQIFSGWHEHIGLLDAETIEKIENSYPY